MTPPRQRPRTCVACREESPKKALIRVVRSPAGAVALDERGKLPGRGAYICARRECLEKARKNKSLARALKTEVPDALYDQLGEYIETYREKHGTADDQNHLPRELRSLLGLSRRAGLLHIGIDSVKSQSVKEPLLILTAADASEAVNKAVEGIVVGQVEGSKYRHVHVCAPLNVDVLSAAIGAAGVRVIALPARNGLADKIKMLLPEEHGICEREGGVALE